LTCINEPEIAECYGFPLFRCIAADGGVMAPPFCDEGDFKMEAPRDVNCTMPRLNEPAPVFTAKTTHGPKTLGDYRGKWLILFSHPVAPAPSIAAG